MTHVTGRSADGSMVSVKVGAGQPGGKLAFDITPARLVTGLITERGICAASEEGLLSLYPEKRKSAVGKQAVSGARLLPTA